MGSTRGSPPVNPHDRGITQSGGGFQHGRSYADTDPSPGAWRVVGSRRTSPHQPNHGVENKPPWRFLPNTDSETGDVIPDRPLSSVTARARHAALSAQNEHLTTNAPTSTFKTSAAENGDGQVPPQHSAGPQTATERDPHHIDVKRAYLQLNLRKVGDIQSSLPFHADANVSTFCSQLRKFITDTLLDILQVCGDRFVEMKTSVWVDNVHFVCWKVPCRE